nr:PREDICTED: solute carrier family 22 member 23 [Anolis carolinensis]|eukprot:XP_008122471.1 PREDICTED: solute carrier family 22 member 23 [Anolis carolinensis]
MAIDRRRDEGGGEAGGPLPEENGALPAGEADPAAVAEAPAAAAAAVIAVAEIQSAPLPAPPPGPCSPLLLDYDGSVLPLLGGLGGGHQRTLILLTWIPALFIGFSQFSDSFLLVQPVSWCKGANGTAHPPVPARNLGYNYSSAADNNGTSYSRGMQAAPELPTPEAPNQSYCECTERYHRITAGLRQNIVSQWDLVCDSSWKVHIAKFSLLVGLIFGYLITGCIADWIGRRPVLLFSVLFILIFGLTVALSVNVTMFSTLRFFEGFCLAGIILSLYALRIELCPPNHRFMITMVASFVAMAGQFLMPGLAALCRDWQVLQAVIICPFLLMLLYWFFFPESLRWLVATQQFETAKKLILHLTCKNRTSTECDIKGVMPGHRSSLTALPGSEEKERPSRSSRGFATREFLMGEVGSSQAGELEKELARKPKKVCIVKVVGTRNLWKNIVVLCVNSLTGFGIHHCFAKSMMGHEDKMSLTNNFYADYYTMAGIALISCLVMCPVVGFLGRRGGLLLFMILTALASLLQLGLLNLIGKYSQLPDSGMSDTVKEKFSTTFSIVGMFSSHAVGSLSVFFCAEITPTVIRGGGLGLVQASAGFGMLTAPIMELHNQKGYFLHHVIFACCTLICIICILLLPESKNQNLPENIPDGEHYTRQPLLPHKKGEQPLLLTNSELKDYSGLHDSAAAVNDSAAESVTANGMKAM